MLLFSHSILLLSDGFLGNFTHRPSDRGYMYLKLGGQFSSDTFFCVCVRMCMTPHNTVSGTLSLVVMAPFRPRWVAASLLKDVFKQRGDEGEFGDIHQVNPHEIEGQDNSRALALNPGG